MTDSAADRQEYHGSSMRSPGAILAAERTRQGLSVADVAQRLHMSVSQVEALEAADYSRLPRGTFLRGFTRNYARALGLDAESLVGRLAEDAPRETAPAIVVPSQNIRFDPLGQRLSNPYVKAAGIAMALLALGFAAMYWWLFIRPHGVTPAPGVEAAALESPQSSTATPPGASTAAATSPGSPTAPAGLGETAATKATPPGAGTWPLPGSAPAGLTPPAKSTTPLASAPSSKVDTTISATSAPPPATPGAMATAAPSEPPRVAGPGEGTIRLAFRAAAWVEITDSFGKVLLSRTHPGGTSTDVIGRPPFNIVIGNSAEVRMTYNGREIDLAPHTRVAVARFTLPLP